MRILDAILATRAATAANDETQRLHRYSYGTCSASRLDANWTAMIDLPATTPILARSTRAVSGPRRRCMSPGAIECQHLHWDQKESLKLTPGRLEHAERLGIALRKSMDRTNSISRRSS
jgi:hypothetical protein